MAIFTDPGELNRQSEYKAFDRVKGANKVLMSALGYKDTGELNTWGNVIGGGGIAGNLIAGGLAKGTDAGDVVKSGRDEALNQSIQGAALGLNVAKTLATGGVGSAMSGGKKGLGLISKINKENDMMDAQEKLKRSVDKSEAMNDVGNVLNPDSFKSMDSFKRFWEGRGYTYDEDTQKLLDKDGNPYLLEDDNKMKDILGQTGNALGNVLTGDVMDSAANYMVARGGYKSALTDEFKEMEHKSELDLLNYL
jgi:hypothetical protein